MAVVAEVVEAERYVFTLLNALALAPVYSGQAPLSTAASPVSYPLIVMQALSAKDTIVIGAARVWATVPVLVKVATEQPSFAAIAPIFAACDAALHASSGVTATARICSCVREQSWTLYPADNGIVYRTIVGRYLVAVQPL